MNDNRDNLTKPQRIGQRIKAERTNPKRPMTQIALAHMMNTTQNTISNWENGKIPPLDQLVRLAEIFKCDVAFLLCECEERNKELQEICDYVGLSTDAVNALHTLAESTSCTREFQQGAVNAILTAPTFWKEVLKRLRASAEILSYPPDTGDIEERGVHYITRPDRPAVFAVNSKTAAEMQLQFAVDFMKEIFFDVIRDGDNTTQKQ